MAGPLRSSSTPSKTPRVRIPTGDKGSRIATRPPFFFSFFALFVPPLFSRFNTCVRVLSCMRHVFRSNSVMCPVLFPSFVRPTCVYPPYPSLKEVFAAIHYRNEHNLQQHRMMTTNFAAGRRNPTCKGPGRETCYKKIMQLFVSLKQAGPFREPPSLSVPYDSTQTSMQQSSSN